MVAAATSGRQARLVLRILYTGFLVRVMVAAWNSFIGPTVGANIDATGLHDVAVTFSQDPLSTSFHLGYLYSFLLGLFYRITVPSLFLGCALSCVAWLVSALAFRATMELLKIQPSQQARAMGVYAFLPTSIAWTAVTIREPYQLMAVSVVTYSAVKIFVRGGLKYWVLLLGTVAFGSLMHAVIFAWGVSVAAVTQGSITWRRHESLGGARLLIVVPLVALIMLAGLVLFTTLWEYPIDKGLAYAVQSYQNGGLGIGGRTNYRNEVTLSNTLDLIYFVPVCLLQYLFEPMPWHVSSVGDLAVTIDNGFRFLLLLSAFHGMIRRDDRDRAPLYLVLFGWLLLETAFSLGTFNWGTSARHHIPAVGLLAILAFAHPYRLHARPAPLTGATTRAPLAT